MPPRRPRDQTYKNLLLQVLDDLDDEKPHDPLARRIIAAFWSHGDLAGVSDRFTAVRMLPPEIRDAVIANAEREGQAIIAAKAPVVPYEVWAAQVEARRR